MDLQKIEKKIIKLVKRASKIYYGKDFIEIEERHKHPKDDVTNNDIKTQEYIRTGLVKLIPNSSFIGEEGNELTDNDYCWILDPIDGTRNYKKSVPLYGTQLALQYKKETILSVAYFPEMKELYVANEQGVTLNGKPIALSTITQLDWSVVCLSNITDITSQKQLDIQVKLMRYLRSVRLFGCMAYNFAVVARGKMDALVMFGNTPWDFEPGKFLIEKCGGVVYYNKKYDMYIAGNKELVKNIKEVLEV